MDPFFRALLQRSPLTSEEEIALARRSRAGDRGARDELIVASMRLVVLAARRRGIVGEELREAVQRGAVGLIRAVDRFDPDRGVRLATYAWHWIGAEMSVPRHPEVPLGPEHDRADLRVGDEPRVPEDADVLTDLAPDVAAVAALRWGLGGECLTRPAVAERLGLTVGQVRTFESKAMRHLRQTVAKVVDRAPPCGGADPL